ATSNTLRLIAVISVALGFTNLLPIPALDGGRILLTLPELITGKRRISVKLENALNAVGFILLLALLAFTTLQDIINPLQLK
ncbi:MAG TPA: site-2 protease family protein, partial [Anaerolineaceae bacterium]|nr:site-2 protease family protein [Anaerolineaceae bacterium]